MAELQLGPITFPTKANAAGWLRERKDMPVGTLFTYHGQGNTDYNVLQAALERHPDRVLYPTAQPEFFSVSLCPVYQQSRLTAHWTQLNKQDIDIVWRFSYRRCIAPYPSKHQVWRAFWFEITDQLRQARTPGRCHVVHVGDMDLDLLIEVFLELHKVPQAKRTPKELLKKSGLIKNTPLLRDRVLAAQWRDWHEQKAQLKAMTCDEYVRYVKDDREDILLGVNP